VGKPLFFCSCGFRVRLAIPAPSSAMISLPSSDFIPNQPRALACISWDDGKEVCRLRYRHLGFLVSKHPDANLSSRSRKCVAGIFLLSEQEQG